MHIHLQSFTPTMFFFFEESSLLPAVLQALLDRSAIAIKLPALHMSAYDFLGRGKRKQHL